MHHAAQENLDHQETEPSHQGHGCASTTLIIVLLLTLGGVGLFATWVISEVIVGPYESRIYPNVYVSDVDLGGLTPDEASKHLAQAFSHRDVGLLALSDGERTRAVPWSEAGLRLDVSSTVQMAFAVGHADHGLRTFLSMWGGRHEVAPVFTVDPEMARAVLERLAPEMAAPPTDATLRLEGDQLIAVPGQPGRALDVDTTVEKIIATVAHLGPNNRFALTFQPVPPRIADANQVLARAEEMLHCQVQLSTYDWLTDETFAWTLGREAIATWLRVEQAEDGTGPSIRIAEEAVPTTLAELMVELGEGRAFRLEEATEQVLNMFEAGGGEVRLRLIHLPRTYVVESGDDLTRIAARFGMPPGLIAEANSDVDLNLLHVGQELTIPSEDVVRPYPPVPGKQIVISIAEQRIRVYENGELLYNWPVSTGIADSPTYVGSFQILSKEENAYASQWNLWMPHFMAVYRAGGDVYNGIHALPILSNGQRLWEGSLGSPASFGCIILGIQEAETLYHWAEIGVPVTIE